MIWAVVRSGNYSTVEDGRMDIFSMQWVVIKFKTLMMSEIQLEIRYQYNFMTKQKTNDESSNVESGHCANSSLIFLLNVLLSDNVQAF